ncbi:MAG: hypothetical protein U5R30_02160 [Deltaproteobacteria bacterium]|nr:hypothetical protein [Deltaproteobacteria bacterium]
MSMTANTPRTLAMMKKHGDELEGLKKLLQREKHKSRQLEKALRGG